MLFLSEHLMSPMVFVGVNVAIAFGFVNACVFSLFFSLAFMCYLFYSVCYIGYVDGLRFMFSHSGHVFGF